MRNVATATILTLAPINGCPGWIAGLRMGFQQLISRGKEQERRGWLCSATGMG